jgi:hypothetical protein
MFESPLSFDKIVQKIYLVEWKVDTNVVTSNAPIAAYTKASLTFGKAS